MKGSCILYLINKVLHCGFFLFGQFKMTVCGPKAETPTSGIGGGGSGGGGTTPEPSSSVAGSLKGPKAPLPPPPPSIGIFFLALLSSYL